MAAASVILVATTILLALRLYVRSLPSVKSGLEDFFLLPAYILSLGACITALREFSLLFVDFFYASEVIINRVSTKIQSQSLKVAPAAMSKASCSKTQTSSSYDRNSSTQLAG